MPLFAYTARDQDGMVLKGKIDALNLQSAHSALKDINLIPEEIHEATKSEKETIQLTKGSIPPEWKILPLPPVENADLSAKEKESKRFFHFTDTLRLYAGWLLAGYFAVYVLGLYQFTKPLPFQIPYVLAFIYSPLILSFTLGCFLFLLLTDIHRMIKGKTPGAAVLTVIGVVVFVFYRANT